MGQGNGLLRLGDAISWPAVSTSAGSDRMVLSFQRGFLPIIQVCLLSIVEDLYILSVDYIVLLVKLCRQEHVEPPRQVGVLKELVIKLN